MNRISMRDAFFNALYPMATADRDIIIVSADMGAPALDQYRENLPAQFVNVGIAEQNMVNVATGLAMEGKKVFAYAIMPFATLRCYELTKVNVALMKQPVTIVGVGAGFSYDDSGPTHHSTEDLTVMRALPNMTVYSPSDSVMAAAFARMAAELQVPSYVRLDREVLPFIYEESADFGDGLAVLREPGDLAIVATGNMVHRALEVADALKALGIDAGVIDVYRVKPLNTDLLLSKLKNVSRLVTMEEHLLAGGFSGAVLEFLADSGLTVPVKRFGVDDKYLYAYGGRKNIQKLCGLDAETVTGSISAWLGGK